MSDLLRMDYINSLPQPFLARFCGDKDFWPVNDFEVGTGLMRIDVCGLLDVKHFGEVMEIKDGNDVTHDPDTFYSDWTDEAPDDLPIDEPALEAELMAEVDRINRERVAA
ncbi:MULTISPECIES: hypothetical protein [unclassified Rhizobium]|uniref:hypothetical protein n=1 Tax=unclassified Rhizobium TaxID=2613769 RepID=UPI00288AD0E8|nr:MULTISPECIES: hypothetical protein [unclassified Rhizobium]